MAKTRVQKVVVKEFKKTKVSYAEVKTDTGVPVMSDAMEVVLDGGLNNADCINALLEQGVENPIILSTETMKEKYMMSVEDFISHAQLVKADENVEETDSAE